LSRDGKEPSLLGFGSVRVLQKVRFGSVRFEFLAGMGNLGSVRVLFGSCSVCFEFGTVLYGFGRLTVLILHH